MNLIDLPLTNKQLSKLAQVKPGDTNKFQNSCMLNFINGNKHILFGDHPQIIKHMTKLIKDKYFIKKGRDIIEKPAIIDNEPNPHSKFYLDREYADIVDYINSMELGHDYTDRMQGLRDYVLGLAMGYNIEDVIEHSFRKSKHLGPPRPINNLTFDIAKAIYTGAPPQEIKSLIYKLNKLKTIIKPTPKIDNFEAIQSWLHDNLIDTENELDTPSKIQKILKPYKSALTSSNPPT
jgi:hypothetical protein